MDIAAIAVHSGAHGTFYLAEIKAHEDGLGGLGIFVEKRTHLELIRQFHFADDARQVWGACRAGADAEEIIEMVCGEVCDRGEPIPPIYEPRRRAR